MSLYKLVSITNFQKHIVIQLIKQRLNTILKKFLQIDSTIKKI